MTTQEQGSTSEATLNLLLRHGKASAGDLAGLLKISVQAMRRHLRTLELRGFVKSRPISLGPGRPSNVWELTTQGHNRFHRGSQRFALELLELIDTRLSSETLATLLDDQAKKKAIDYREKIGNGDMNTRLENLVKLRHEEGYLTEFSKEKVPGSSISSWYLNAFHCAIRSVAEEYPILCEQELQLIRYIFPDCQVQRVQWGLEDGHACGFKLTPSNALS